MNELDKQSSPVDDLTLNEAPAASEASTTDASSIHENAECEKICENDEASPALENAEAAEKEEDSDVVTRNYHSMTKQEMLEALNEIVTSGNMEAHKEVAAIKQAYYSLRNREMSVELEAFVEKGNSAEAFSATPDETETEMKQLLSDFREKRSAYLEEKEEQRRKNLEEKNRIISELKAIVEDIDNINLHFPKFQELQQKFKEVGEAPAGSDSEVWKSYQITVEQFYDRWKMNKELRDLDFKKNLEQKTLLVEKAKSLAEIEDPIEAFRCLQTLHDQWREIGPVAREVREEIWNQFKEASTVVNKRHQDFFQEKKVSEQANEDAKTALCEKVEAIDFAAFKGYSEWDAATKEIIAMQQEWKGLGYASRKMNNVLFARFRKSCDEFFTAKGEYYKKTKDEIKDNLSKKEALCEKAEALLERYQERSSFDEMQALQKEWRTIGVVRRRQGDEIWKRFCAAVDAFYDARRKLLSGRREEETENLNAKKEIIEKLKAIPEDADRKDVIGIIRDLQAEWQNTGHVPFKHKDAVNGEYRAELDRLYGAFDLRESRQRMRRFEGEIKKMEGDGNKISRERERLVRAMEARQAELKTIENNLGFFSIKSSAGNSMLKDFERKIQKIKEDISQIQEKIKLLDKQEGAEKTESAE